jgi:hypothetical protein
MHTVERYSHPYCVTIICFKVTLYAYITSQDKKIPFLKVLWQYNAISANINK